MFVFTSLPSSHSWYHCAGLTTVDVRVCGSPGRDKMATTDKKTGKGKQEAEDGECEGVVIGECCQKM